MTLDACINKNIFNHFVLNFLFEPSFEMQSAIYFTKICIFSLLILYLPPHSPIHITVQFSKFHYFRKYFYPSLPQLIRRRSHGFALYSFNILRVCIFLYILQFFGNKDFSYLNSWLRPRCKWAVSRKKLAERSTLVRPSQLHGSTLIISYHGITISHVYLVDLLFVKFILVQPVFIQS